MFDKLLEFGSMLDWISPLIAIYKDLTNGSYQRFYINRACGWSCNDITRMLKKHGITVWGDTIQDDMIIFTVKEAQAKWTEYLLKREGLIY